MVKSRRITSPVLRPIRHHNNRISPPWRQSHKGSPLFGCINASPKPQARCFRPIHPQIEPRSASPHKGKHAFGRQLRRRHPIRRHLGGQLGIAGAGEPPGSIRQAIWNIKTIIKTIDVEITEAVRGLGSSICARVTVLEPSWSARFPYRGDVGGV